MSVNPSEESNSNSDRKISRRDFLNFIGATGAIFTLSSLVPSAKAFASGANTTYTNSSQTSVSPPPQPKAMTSPHVFNLDTAMPQISNISGSRTIVNADNFPIFNGNGMAAYLLRLKQGGVYEPHWHPNAAELDYVIEGRARMTILSPGGSVDTFEVNPGQIVFIPPAYFHYIENPDSINNMHFAVFFGHEKPEDIGISGALSAYSNEVLAAVFNLDPTLFDKLPKLEEDVFVVTGAA